MPESTIIESRIAHCRERDADDYPYVVHGVAQAAGELTNGLNGPKYWPAAELRQAAPTLEGQTVYSVHEGERRAVGTVLRAAYDDSRDAVVYEAGLEDAEIGEALSIGEREPTIEAGNPDAVDQHDKTGAVIMRGFEYTGMATTEKGASDASYAAPGPANQNPAVAALSAGAIEATLDEDAQLAVGDDEWSADMRLFRVVPADDEEDQYDADVLGVGVSFPESGVYVDWHTAAFPDELDDPHVSEYGSLSDLQKATGNQIVDIEPPTGELAYSLLSELDDLAAGDVVSWRTGNGTLAYGKVRATIRRGEFDNWLSTERVVTAPAVLISVYEPGQGSEWTETDRLVARKPDSVTGHEDFPAAPDSEARRVSQAQLQGDISYEITNVSPAEIAADDGPGFTDDPWNGDDVEASLPNLSEDDDAPDVLDRTMALVPTDDDTRDVKANWKAPFRDGPSASVNTRALVAIDAAISGARGGFEDVSDEVLSSLADWSQSMLEAAPDDLFGADDAEAAAASVAMMAATGAHPDDPTSEADTGEGLGSGRGAVDGDADGTDAQSSANTNPTMGSNPNHEDRIEELEAELEAKNERIAELEAGEREELEAELEDKEERLDDLEDEVAELREQNEELEEQNEAARERYAAALAEADTLLSEEELAEKYTLAELAEKAEEADFSDDDGGTEPFVRSGGGSGAEANLSADEQERKAELESRLDELEETDGALAEKQREKVKAELAELTGGEA
jgi:hypothetical protein